MCQGGEGSTNSPRG